MGGRDNRRRRNSKWNRECVVRKRGGGDCDDLKGANVLEHGRKWSRCLWCGKECRYTIDHVPPKAVFPKRLAPSLPQVPSCSGCNSSWGRDGEYFRDMLLRGPLARCQHPELVEIREASRRASERRAGIHRKESVFKTAPILSLSPSGLLFPSEVERIDLTRIAGVISRTVIAIYITAARKIFDWQDDIYDGATMDIRADSPHYPRAREILAGGNTNYAGGLLRWCDFVSSRDPNEQEWLLSFYDEAVFHFRSFRKMDPPQTSGIFEGVRYISASQWRTLS